MDDSKRAEAPAVKSGSGSNWLLLLFVAAIAALWWVRPQRESGNPLLGQAFPPLEVAGWINTDAPPDPSALRGQVVLVDFWASWCGPCRAKMPKLVEFHQQYRDQGLVLLGLTPETHDDLPQVESYVSSVAGFDWPIGYGAYMIVEMMGVPGYPTLMLFDRSGKSIWAGHGFDGLEDAVIHALAEQPPQVVRGESAAADRLLAVDE